ncbi:hypothetical protein F4805DRAFT_472571 [Annulohypoxylon moriforme]|nr:hypothetical protein F4805DRAFT_472571 [Annulohypoxylon moriforme]
MALQLTDHSDGPVIEEFIQKYKGVEYLGYAKLTEISQSIMHEELKRDDIKYELYDRGSENWAKGKAKDPISARRTAFRRQNARREKYQSVKDIFEDMHDLSAIRIALYYPNDFEKVQNLISKRFEEDKPYRDWPDLNFGPRRYPTLDGSDSAKTDISGRRSRFPGYFARHYHVRLKPEDAKREPATEGRVIEIQLVSLLMHTWSKMHHELIYKSQEGHIEPDEDDERLIDLSNGIIIAGEQMLRHIQICLDKKTMQGTLPFKNELEFLSCLRDCWNKHDLRETPRHETISMADGYMEGILYRTLCAFGLNNPSVLDSIVARSGCDDIGVLIECLVEAPYFTIPETKTLRLPDWEESYTGRRIFCHSDSLSTCLRLARCYAWISNNAIKFVNNPQSLSKHLQTLQKRDKIVIPSGNEFLRLIHPRSQPQHLLPSIKTLLTFFEAAADWKNDELDESSWELSVALSRLTWYPVPFGLEKVKYKPGALGTQDEDLFTICPKYLTDLLDDLANNKVPRKVKNRDRYTVLLPPENYEDNWKVYVPKKQSQTACIVGLECIKGYIDRFDTLLDEKTEGKGIKRKRRHKRGTRKRRRQV